MKRSVDEVDRWEVVVNIVHIDEVTSVRLELQGILSFHSTCNVNIFNDSCD